MNVSWFRAFLILVIVLLVLGFVMLYAASFHYNFDGESHMDNLTQGQVAYGKEVPVVVINLREDGALDTKGALYRGELYVLMEVLNNKTRIFFNDLVSLQQLDEYQEGMLSINNRAYKNLEVGQFSRGGKGFYEESLASAGIRAIELYPEPKQKDKYGQVLGEAVMANGNRYPLQVVNIESKDLGL